jgi:hypothetical protein
MATETGVRTRAAARRAASQAHVFDLGRLLTDWSDLFLLEVLGHLDGTDLAMLGRTSRDLRHAVKRSPGGVTRAGSEAGCCASSPTVDCGSSSLLQQLLQLLGGLGFRV